MNTSIRRLFRAAALVVAATVVTAAHAVIVTVDFNPPALTGLYFAGDSFTESGFRMTADFDFGTVDVASALGGLAPSGNITPFYFNSNDGGLIVEQEAGLPFSLLGFSAAFVPLSPPSSQVTALVAVATATNNTQVALAWLFAPPVSGIYPFASYSNAADFAPFVNLRDLEFFTCSLVNGQLCTAATRDNAQFAIDDIRLSFVAPAAVPEPSSVALLLLALLILGATLRRNFR